MPKYETPEGVVDQESADDFLDSVFSDETPESGSEAPGEGETPPAQPDDDDGPPRDELGRFASQQDDGEAATAEEREAEPAPEPAAPESEGTEPEGAEEQPEAGLTDEEWDALPPMQYRAEGQDWHIAGSKVEEDGVFIPNDQLPHVVRLFQEGHAHRGSFRQTLSAKDDQIAEIQAQLEAERAATTVIKEQLEKLVTTDGALEEWVANQKANYDVLMAQAENARTKRELEAANERNARSEAASAWSRDLPAMQDLVAEAVTHWGGQAGFDETVQRRLYDLFTHPDELAALFPMREDGSGRDDHRQTRIHDYILSLLQVTGTAPASGPTPAPAAPAAPAAPEKPAAAAPSSETPPAKPRRQRRRAPAGVSGKGGGEAPPAAGEKKIPEFASTEEADAWFDRGGYNEHT